MIEIAAWLTIDENEIRYEFVRASGPGGQNVNKVATSVQLRFDVRNSASLPITIKERLMKLAGSRMTTEGVLVLDGRRFRTQEQNRYDVTQRLISLIKRALEKPKPRRATRPTLSSKIARVDNKKRRGAIKRTRKITSKDWE
ncbi:MAG: aminoacyl-tRNA hydrolase [Anaerolineaceae bacterium]|nr:aminoacyl-tRNA hydrolase [Anaerolineaceae bacterium]